MDTKVIGQFLAQLRKEKDLTQEQLGEMLGVTNKTVSRWENGNYLPPVEMLQQLSELYGLTINELLSGKPLEDQEFRQQAENNIKAVLSQSFSEGDRADYFKRKWKKDHRLANILGAAVLFAGYIVNMASAIHDHAFFFGVGLIAFWIIRYQEMMAYVEAKLFDTEPCQVRLKRLRVAAMILLGIGLWITADLGYNYVSSLPAELNDGITMRGIFAGLVFGDDGWSRAGFLRAFAVAAGGTLITAVANITLACIEKLKK